MKLQEMNCNRLEIEYWKKNILDVVSSKFKIAKYQTRGVVLYCSWGGKKNQWSICYVLERAVYILTSSNRRCGMSFLKSGLEKMRKQTGKAARTPTMSLASKWLHKLHTWCNITPETMQEFCSPCRKWWRCR